MNCGNSLLSDVYRYKMEEEDVREADVEMEGGKIEGEVMLEMPHY